MMKTTYKTQYFSLLCCSLLWISPTQAQVCNQNMPLRTPTHEFLDHEDGTVTHLRTGLMWKKCAEGRSGVNCEQGDTTNPDVVMLWNQALIAAESREYAGYSDWRLPNIKELFSIVEDVCHQPTINLAVFPNDPSTLPQANSAYDAWSASPVAGAPYTAWGVSFRVGAIFPINKTTRFRFVRLVRDDPR